MDIEISDVSTTMIGFANRSRGPKLGQMPTEMATDEHESSLDREIPNEDEEIARLWSPYLYSLQRRAPKSQILPVGNEILDDDLGIQGYHGLISKAEAIEKLLPTNEGTFLVRQKPSGQYIVSLRFSSDVKHYAIKQHDKKILYSDKEFDSIREMVDDTLIGLFLEQHDIFDQMKIGRTNRKNNRAFRRRNGMRLKLDNVDQKRHLKNNHSRSLSDSPESNNDVDGVFSEVHSDDHDDKPVQVLVEDEGGRVTTRSKGGSEKLKRRHGHRLRKATFDVTVPSPTTDRKSCPQEIVNLLSIYTGYSTNSDYNLYRSKSTSAGSLNNRQKDNSSPILDSTGAVGMLLRQTLSIHSSEDIRTKSGNSSPATLSRNGSTSSYGKSHNFKIATYKGPTWCDVCNHFLWGLVQQGMKCQDCGINVHKLCVEDAQDLIDCIPSKKLIKRVFGVDLTTLVLLDDEQIPTFLKQTIDEVEKRGLMSEGIYRVAGRTMYITDLKEKVDTTDTVDYSLVQDVHVLSAAIKLFLRELPIPLITFDAYPHVLEHIKLAKPDFKTIKQSLIKHLPKAHYDTLQYLILHLSKIAEFSNINKMESSNLAVVFAPTVMRSINPDDLLLHDIPLQTKLMEFLISNHEDIFVPS